MSSSEFPIAFVVKEYENKDGEFGVFDFDIRVFDGELYKIWRDNKGIPHKTEDLFWSLKRASQLCGGREYEIPLTK